MQFLQRKKDRETEKELRKEKGTKLNLVGTMVVSAETDQEKTEMAKKEAQLSRLRKINATVIPAPRKSVKRMMFETVVEFIRRLFSSEQNPTKQDDACFKLNPMGIPPGTANIKRIYPR